MFKFLKRKNCDFHIKQIDKCLGSVLENYIRADKYLLGGGFGGRVSQVRAAHGAVGKAKKKLFEAYNNYCDGVEDIEGEYDKMGLANVIMKYGEVLNIYAVFETDDIRDHWVQTMKTFVSSCKKVFNYSELKD
jgi:hypothetical protein